MKKKSSAAFNSDDEKKPQDFIYGGKETKCPCKKSLRRSRAEGRDKVKEIPWNNFFRDG